MDDRRVRVDPQHVEAFKRWVAAHQRAAAAVGVGG